MEKLILIGNLMISGFLTGLIWFVQVVHYPIFAKVSPQNFADFHRAHTFLTGKVVALPMLIELLLSVFLLVKFWGKIPLPLNAACFLLVLAIWAITFFWFIPQHGKLSAGFDAQLIGDLVKANGWRTALWTLRLLLLGWIALNLLTVRWVF